MAKMSEYSTVGGAIMFTLRGERNSRGSDLLVGDHKGVGYALIMSEMVTFEQDMTQ